MKKYPLPTQRQEEWADLELGVIIHHTMEVYHPDIPISEWKSSPEKMPAESFAPTDENTDQWIEAASKMGAKYAVLVANHVTGFSLWNTKANDYSIAKSPYKDGKADIVRDFIDSCKKYGIKPGLYYSLGANGYYKINDLTEKNYKSKRYQDYVKVVESQIRELWSNYGELYEIWFDGGVIPYEKGGPNIVPILEELQPNAVCFQGPKEHHQNLRWVGNERGIAPLDCWSTTFTDPKSYGGEYEVDEIGVGNPNGDKWIPAETDMGNRKQQAFGGGWGWRENESHLIYSPEELLDRYITSVGRNSNLLVGMCIDQSGHFEDTKQFEDFGKLVKDLYKNPIKSTKGEGTVFKLTFDKLEEPRYLIIKEDIHTGERVRAFTVEVERENGTTEEFFTAKCIGHKRIVPLNGKIRSVTLKITDSTDTPQIKDITCYR